MESTSPGLPSTTSPIIIIAPPHKDQLRGNLFGGTLVIGLITEPLGFVQDA